MKAYVLEVFGGIEPNLHGPFEVGELLRLEALRLHAAQDPETDSVFVLRSVQGGPNKGDIDIETYGTGLTESLSGDEFENGPFCRFCTKLAGPDHHIAGVIDASENNIVCPRCFDPRLA